MKNSKSLLIIICVLAGALVTVSIIDWIKSGWSNDLWLNFVICISLVGSVLIETRREPVSSEENSQG